MDDAMRFRTTKDVYNYLGPGSYDTHSTLTNDEQLSFNAE